jgi:hypothetical protein
MEHETAGDPTSHLKWARKSTRKMSQELNRENISASPRTTARLLKTMGFSLRSNRKTVAGTQHPDRSQQFDYIAQMKNQFASLGEPILSMDSKKKELIGNFANPGRAWGRQAEKVSDHDFRSTALGIGIPYGIYDCQTNEGLVVVGTSHDTPAFAGDALVSWAKNSAPKHYPEIEQLLIFCDTGGSNSCRARAWKYALQKRICDPFQLSVTVCHYPTGASKWNPVEHRLFSYISINWAGKPLRSFETMLKYIRTTTTQTGLKIRAILNKKKYPTGVKIDDRQMSEINLRVHDTLPQWNYTIYPTGRQWN